MSHSHRWRIYFILIVRIRRSFYLFFLSCHDWLISYFMLICCCCCFCFVSFRSLKKHRKTRNSIWNKTKISRPPWAYDLIDIHIARACQSSQEGSEGEVRGGENSSRWANLSGNDTIHFASHLEDVAGTSVQSPLITGRWSDFSPQGSVWSTATWMWIFHPTDSFLDSIPAMASVLSRLSSDKANVIDWCTTVQIELCQSYRSTDSNVDWFSRAASHECTARAAASRIHFEKHSSSSAAKDAWIDMP